MANSTDHVPRLCPVCEGPLTAHMWCWKCKLPWKGTSWFQRKMATDPFLKDIPEILRQISEDY